MFSIRAAGPGRAFPRLKGSLHDRPVRREGLQFLREHLRHKKSNVTRGLSSDNIAFFIPQMFFMVIPHQLVQNYIPHYHSGSL